MITEKQREWNKQYWLKNKEILTEKRRIYRENNKAKLLEMQKRYRENNSEAIKEKNKKYRQENAGKLKEYSKQYNLENQEKIKQYGRQWRKDNPDKQKALRQRNKESHRIDKHNRDSRRKQLPHTFTKTQWKRCKSHFNNVCCYCGQKTDLTQEHFIAMTKGGGYTADNILPACNNCNCSKNNSDFFEWYPQQPFYSQVRVNKILKYLSRHKEVKQIAIGM
jgi:hypothetical protein